MRKVNYCKNCKNFVNPKMYVMCSFVFVFIPGQNYEYSVCKFMGLLQENQIHILHALI